MVDSQSGPTGGSPELADRARSYMTHRSWCATGETVRGECNCGLVAVLETLSGALREAQPTDLIARWEDRLERLPDGASYSDEFKAGVRAATRLCIKDVRASGPALREAALREPSE